MLCEVDSTEYARSCEQNLNLPEGLGGGIQGGLSRVEMWKYKHK